MRAFCLSTVGLFVLFSQFASQTSAASSSLLNNLSNLRSKALSGRLSLSVDELRQRTQKFVAGLNNLNAGWQARVLDRFAAMNNTKKMRLAGLRDPEHLPQIEAKMVEANDTSDDNIIANASSSSSSSRRKRATATCTNTVAFDSRTAWPGCASIIGIVQDQSGCGNCWAVATASAYQDRYCIQRAKASVSTSATNISNFVSAIDITSCSPSSSGCDGGSPYYAWNWIKSTGVATGTNYSTAAGCKPYPFPPLSSSTYSTPSCSSFCSNSAYTTAYASDKRKASWTKYLASSTSTVSAIQAEIKANGSVVASMYVYEDFYYYSSGVYTQTSSNYMGGHAVRLIGWGTQTCTNGTSTDYWLAVNSWNTDWGLNGLFQIKRGADTVGIESLGIYYGTPTV